MFVIFIIILIMSVKTSQENNSSTEPHISTTDLSSTTSDDPSANKSSSNVLDSGDATTLSTESTSNNASYTTDAEETSRTIDNTEILNNEDAEISSSTNDNIYNNENTTAFQSDATEFNTTSVTERFSEFTPGSNYGTTSSDSVSSTSVESTKNYFNGTERIEASSTSSFVTEDDGHNGKRESSSTISNIIIESETSSQMSTVSTSTTKSITTANTDAHIASTLYSSKTTSAPSENQHLSTTSNEDTYRSTTSESTSGLHDTDSNQQMSNISSLSSSSATSESSDVITSSGKMLDGVRISEVTDSNSNQHPSSITTDSYQEVQNDASKPITSSPNFSEFTTIPNKDIATPVDHTFSSSTHVVTSETSLNDSKQQMSIIPTGTSMDNFYSINNIEPVPNISNFSEAVTEAMASISIDTTYHSETFIKNVTDFVEAITDLSKDHTTSNVNMSDSNTHLITSEITTAASNQWFSTKSDSVKTNTFYNSIDDNNRKYTTSSLSFSENIDEVNKSKTTPYQNISDFGKDFITSDTTVNISKQLLTSFVNSTTNVHSDSAYDKSTLSAVVVENSNSFKVSNIITTNKLENDSTEKVTVDFKSNKNILQSINLENSSTNVYEETETSSHTTVTVPTERIIISTTTRDNIYRNSINGTSNWSKTSPLVDEITVTSHHQLSTVGKHTPQPVLLEAVEHASMKLRNISNIIQIRTNRIKNIRRLLKRKGVHKNKTSTTSEFRKYNILSWFIRQFLTLLFRS